MGDDNDRIYAVCSVMQYVMQFNIRMFYAPSVRAQKNKEKWEIWSMLRAKKTMVFRQKETITRRNISTYNHAVILFSKNNVNYISQVSDEI